MNILTFGRRAIFAFGIAAALSACTSVMQDAPGQQRVATVDRVYVIDCGENHAKDVSLWTASAADKGKAYVYSNHCYLIHHPTGWILWDSGNPDRIATMPHGLVNPRGTPPT